MYKKSPGTRGERTSRFLLTGAPSLRPRFAANNWSRGCIARSACRRSRKSCICRDFRSGFPCRFWLARVPTHEVCGRHTGVNRLRGPGCPPRLRAGKLLPAEVTPHRRTTCRRYVMSLGVTTSFISTPTLTIPPELQKSDNDRGGTETLSALSTAKTSMISCATAPPTGGK